MLDLDDGFINQIENNNANYSSGLFSLNATDTIPIGQNEKTVVLTYISSVSSSDLNKDIPIQPAIPIMKIYGYESKNYLILREYP